MRRLLAVSAAAHAVEERVGTRHGVGVLRLDSTFEQASGARAPHSSLNTLMVRRQLELSQWQKLEARGNALALAHLRYEDRFRV